jgi:hypothetical protein
MSSAASVRRLQHEARLQGIMQDRLHPEVQQRPMTADEFQEYIIAQRNDPSNWAPWTDIGNPQ